MSSVPAAPPLATRAVVTHVRRPSTLTVMRWELRKLVSQKRTYMGFGIAVVFPLIFVLAQNLNQHHHGNADNIYLSHITESGLATPVLTLLFESAFLLPLMSLLVAGDIVATEDGNGTLKTILTRSVDRGQVLAAKVGAAALYTIVGLFLSATVATVAGVASWGFNHVTTFSGTIVSAPKGLLLVVAAYGFFLIPLLSVMSIGVLLSTITRNSAAAVVGALGVTLVLALVTVIPGTSAIQPYLLTTEYNNWHGLLRTPTDWAPVLHSLWVCALYAVPALLAAYLVFLRRDVAGG
jgi:ABC-2 type transport system permease protein